MASLFVAQLLHLVAPFIFEMKNQSLCKALSIVTHFAFLAAFFWMNVMSFDIFFTFSTGLTNLGERETSSKRMRFYWLYAWLGAAIIVGSAASVEYTSDSSIKPGYGTGMCWISNSRGLLVFFLVPIAILLFSNFVFFLISAISIHMSSKKISRILKRKNTCKLLIYIKLSVVMGLTWCFGFSAAATNSQALWYLFIFFNTLQGLFIATFFVCTKKVFQIVRDGVSSFYSNTRSFTERKSLASKPESEEGRNASRRLEARY
ncbi:G-protein coupled receptor Mth2-like [Ostrea edulis]|uniref:G-protein coupled receptor Mth2-like n=1 Tax=Ostrea edulis TaxID=37623 RepID=UPI0024AF2DDB|nr:G-protein coupled receptor Mth2-like [Ostrea edulis]